jgi:hypothetical protein
MIAKRGRVWRLLLIDVTLIGTAGDPKVRTSYCYEYSEPTAPSPLTIPHRLPVINAIASAHLVGLGKLFNNAGLSRGRTMIRNRGYTCNVWRKTRVDHPHIAPSHLDSLRDGIHPGGTASRGPLVVSNLQI